MKKKIFLLIFLIFLSFFYSFDLFKINSYNSISYYIPVFFNLNSSNSDIKSELEKNAIFFNSIVFNTNSFLFSRESKRKGFERNVYLDIKLININYKIESYEFIDGFYYIFKIYIPLDDKRRERISNFMKISGNLSTGESSTNYFDWFENKENNEKKDNVFIFTMKNSIIDLINNAIIMKFGRNFMLDIKGSFIITEQPFYIVKSGNIYVKVKGMVFFENY